MRPLDCLEKCLNNLPPFQLFKLFRNGRLENLSSQAIGKLYCQDGGYFAGCHLQRWRGVAGLQVHRGSIAFLGPRTLQVATQESRQGVVTSTPDHVITLESSCCYKRCHLSRPPYCCCTTWQASVTLLIWQSLISTRLHLDQLQIHPADPLRRVLVMVAFTAALLVLRTALLADVLGLPGGLR